MDVDLWQVIGRLVFALFFGTMLYTFFLENQVFRILEEKYPEYYQKIGRPIVLRNGLMRRIRGDNFIFKCLWRGVPADFPHETEAINKIERIRTLFILLLFPAWIMLCVVMIYGRPSL